MEYQAYSQAIRQEYAWVSELEYIIGRKQVLERFWQREKIYFTPLRLLIAVKSWATAVKRFNDELFMEFDFYSFVWIITKDTIYT
ncbi:hypothetical protein NIES806_30370 [Dolichospermum compactum NIES-806]|uniref:Uncharacterized protein n=1 Tax=Dolichospermum compactum NIES-806 TaxID=1973481 RepID=A0A1Z4V5I6_9CYAN|nr:hypothetical protein NIES806_30370 [Dolichospermum compactum NIES-806]